LEHRGAGERNVVLVPPPIGSVTALK